MRSKFLLVIFFLITPAPTIFPLKTTPGKNPDKSQELARWIMNIVIEKSQENEKIKRAHVTYNKTVVKSDLQKTSSNQVTETSTYQIYGQNGQSWERLIERNKRLVKNARPEMSKLDFNAILLERYDFNLEEEEFVNSEKDGLIVGRGYYVISFKPKEPLNRLPFNERLDEGINRATGHIYVDMEKFYLKRMEGKLTNRFTRAMNIFEMKDFSLVFEQEEFEGIIVPSSLVLTYRYRVFWGDTYEKLEYFYNNRKNAHVTPPPK